MGKYDIVYKRLEEHECFFKGNSQRPKTLSGSYAGPILWNGTLEYPYLASGCIEISERQRRTAPSVY